MKSMRQRRSPEKCRFPYKVALTKIQAMRRAEIRGMSWYQCRRKNTFFDHYHIGNKRASR